jgi:GT2 family glycosyltransferase
MGQELAALESLKVETRPILADISVVIPTLGRDILESCLYWMAVGTAWPRELIVVDQGNRPQVKEWLQMLSDAGMGTCYVPSERRGRAAGINRGLREVKTRFVAITDDDCFIDQEWLLKMVTCLRCSPERIFTGRVEPAGMLDVNFCTVTSRTPITYVRPQLRVHPLIGGNIGVAMEQVRQIGFFDEHPSIFSAEDSDWGYRALKKGVWISYNPDILLYHYNWRDTYQRANRYRDYSRSQGAFYGKYLLSGDLLIVLQALRDLVRGPIRWLRGLVLRNQDMIDRGKGDTLELARGILAGVSRKKVT